MKVIAYGDEYQCDKAIKGGDYIRLYDDNGNCIASFEGISDFSGYEIEGGEWSLPEPTEAERIEALEAALLEVILNG